jgi:hypothetical protein
MANLKCVAMIQPRLGDLSAVQECSIAASQIAEFYTLRGHIQPRMAPREFEVQELDIATRLPPKDCTRGQEFEGLFARRFGYDNSGWHANKSPR